MPRIESQDPDPDKNNYRADNYAEDKSVDGPPSVIRPGFTTFDKEIGVDFPKLPANEAADVSVFDDLLLKLGSGGMGDPGRRSPAQASDWNVAEKMFSLGAVAHLLVSGFGSNGVFVRFGRLHAYLPMAELRRREGEDARTPSTQIPTVGYLLSLIGKSVTVSVVEVDRAHEKLIVSERAAKWKPKNAAQVRWESDGTWTIVMPGQGVTGKNFYEKALEWGISATVDRSSDMLRLLGPYSETTPDNLTSDLIPYLKAIEDLQAVIDSVQGLAPHPIRVLSINQ